MIRALRRWSLVGAALYSAAAAADAWCTWRGLAGSPVGEGNPILRRSMEVVGIAPALILEKLAFGAAAFLIALRVGWAIHRSESWVWKVPMLPPVRRWMRRGDRWWVALIPLYGVAAAQAAAALAWLAVGR